MLWSVLMFCLIILMKKVLLKGCVKSRIMFDKVRYINKYDEGLREKKWDFMMMIVIRFFIILMDIVVGRKM